jgi:hypothetical protein
MFSYFYEYVCMGKYCIQINSFIFALSWVLHTEDCVQRKFPMKHFSFLTKNMCGGKYHFNPHVSYSFRRMIEPDSCKWMNLFPY